jgi:hypothetical protein
MGCRLVRPELVVLPLSAGDTITVKQRLSSGEERAMIRRGLSYSATGARTFDPINGGVAKILAYLVDWSFQGLDGARLVIHDQPASVVESALDLLEPESYSEILRAIEAHETAMAAARAAEKKTLTGAPVSSATSPLPAAVAGATSGS